jgi:hypothetical protein
MHTSTWSQFLIFNWLPKLSNDSIKLKLPELYFDMLFFIIPEL